MREFAKKFQNYIIYSSLTYRYCKPALSFYTVHYRRYITKKSLKTLYDYSFFYRYNGLRSWKKSVPTFLFGKTLSAQKSVLEGTH